MNKLDKLKDILKQMDSVLVAYSGGADSTFLLKVASDVLPDRVLAVIADSITYPHQELVSAKKMVKALGARYKVIKTNEFKDKRFLMNSPERCYFCKKELFSKLKEIAQSNKINFVADGSNLSDAEDFRPGRQAKIELGIRSPLQEAGFTKEDIRRMSKELGINTWDKSTQACLASRVPYGIKLSAQVLTRINRAEGYLRQMGFKQSRVRHYNGLCRIEVLGEDIPKVIEKRRLLIEKLKRLSYHYVTVDLEGYRSGSMNEVIK